MSRKISVAPPKKVDALDDPHDSFFASDGWWLSFHATKFTAASSSARLNTREQHEQRRHTSAGGV